MTDPTPPQSARQGAAPGGGAQPAGAEPSAGPPAGPPELPVIFRPAVTRAILLTGAVALLVALTAVALLLPDLGTAQRLSFIITAVLLMTVPVLLSRPKVIADATGVTVVNIISGRRLDWAEILQVNLRHGDPWVFLDLSDGTSLPALGIQPGLARRRAIEDARALRALVDAHAAAEREPGARHG